MQEGQTLIWTSEGFFTNKTDINRLTELEDVSILSDPIHNQLIQFDSSIGKWEANFIESNQLSDFNIISPITNQIIKFDGTEWINRKINTRNLIDVSTSLPLHNQYLSFSTITNLWTPINPTTYQYSTTDLIDVSTSLPDHGDILQWTTNDLYEPKSLFIPTGLSDLIDVELDSVSSMNILIATSGPTRWINSVNSINFCTEVQLGTMNSGDILTVTGGKIRSIPFNKTLDDLSVFTGTPTSNYIVTYTDGFYKPMPFNRSLFDLNNVSGTGVSGDILTYTNGGFVPIQFNKRLQDLSDVGPAPIQPGYFLTYNSLLQSAQWKTITEALDDPDIDPPNFPFGLFVGIFPVITLNDINNLSPLTNTNVSAVTQGSILSFTTRWEPIMPVTYSNVTNLYQLNNISVVTSTLTNNNVLKYNVGTDDWVNSTLSINQLNDVEAATSVNYDILVYTGTSFKNSNILKNSWNFLSSVTSGFDNINGEVLFITNDVITNKKLELKDLSYFEINIEDSLLSDNNIIFTTNGYYSYKEYNINTIPGIELTAPSLDQILVYNGTDFVNQDLILENIGQTALFSPQNGDIFTYTNTAWRNVPSSTLLKLDKLYDTNITSPQSRDIVFFTNSTWKNIPMNDILRIDKCSDTLFLSTPDDGDVVFYTSGFWKNQPINNLLSISNCIDANINTPMTNDIIFYTDSSWTNIPINNVLSLNNCSDVLFDDPYYNDLIVYRDDNWVNVPSEEIIRAVNFYEMAGIYVDTQPNNLTINTILKYEPAEFIFRNYELTDWVPLNATNSVNSTNSTYSTYGNLIDIVNETTDTSCYVAFTRGISGYESICVNTNFRFNSNTGIFQTPNQYKFCAHKTATSDNIRGLTVTTNCGFNSTIFNVGNCFSTANGGTFTAPISGYYQMNVSLLFNKHAGVGGGIYVNLNTSIRTIRIIQDSPERVQPTITTAASAHNWSGLVYMDATNTATISLNSISPTTTTTFGLWGDTTNLYTYWSGYLIN